MFLKHFCGFDGTITYNDQSEQINNVNIKETNQSRKRNRAIIWYNPPYCMSVKTNIGKTFLKYFKNIFHQTTLCIPYLIRIR